MRPWLWLTFPLLIILTCCSGRQTYELGQAWQRDRCLRIADAEARGRCLESADMPYEQYQRQSTDRPEELRPPP